MGIISCQEDFALSIYKEWLKEDNDGQRVEMIAINVTDITLVQLLEDRSVLNVIKTEVYPN